MEAPAPYRTPEAGVDLRELVAPVAVWLAELGFQVQCGPMPDAQTADVCAVWRSSSGTLFDFWMMAQQGWAACECTERIGIHTYTCFSWTNVQELAQVQWLLEQNRQFRQAQARTRRAVAPPGA